MNFIKDASIIKKIGINIIISLLGLVVVGFIGIQNSNSGYDSLIYVDSEIKKVDEIKEFKENVEKIQINYANLLSGFSAYEGATISINNNIKFIGSFIVKQKNSFSDEEAKFFSDFIKDWAKAKPIIKKIELVIEDEDDDAIRELVEDEWISVYFGLVKKIDKLYKHVNAEVSKNILLKQNSLSLNTNIIYGLLPMVIFIVLVVSLMVSRLITTPLKKITRELESNDGSDLSMRLNMTAKDEIGAIARSFDTFFVHLSDVCVVVKESAQSNALVANKTSEITTDIANKTANEQVLVKASSQKGESVKNTLEETLVVIESSNEDIVEANKKLGTTKDSVTDLVADINQASEVESELAVKLSSLSDDTKQVKDVLTVISDIADQTNLLALNAAIEAARAGEHGRGFAVVADEVRNLAERTQKSLVEIDSTISVIVQAIVEASESMNKNSVSIHDLSTKSNDIEEQISDVGSIVLKASEVSSSSLEDFKNMSMTATQLIDEIEKIDMLSSENRQSVEEVVDLMNNLDNSSRELENNIMKFKT